MSAELLPNEILEKIILLLSGRDLGACRGVCKRWKYIIDSYDESVWRLSCNREFGGICKAAYKKGCLSWCELYKSLYLWSRVNEAEVKIYKTIMNRVTDFELLRNGTIACPNHSIPELEMIEMYNTLIYYNLHTQTGICNEYFGYGFQYFEENELIMVIERGSSDDDEYSKILLSVIIKASKRTYCYGKDPSENITNWILLGNYVYYQTDDTICCVKVIMNGAGIDVKLKNNVIGDIPSIMLSIVRADNRRITILTTDDTIYSYSFITKELSFTCCLDETKCKMKQLKEHGFDWGSPLIFPHLEDVQLAKYTINAICTYGKIVITGTGSLIHIYDNPYSPTGELELYDATPVKSFDLYSYRSNSFSKYRVIKKIDVVEILNGHKIVVLYCGKIVVIEMKHEKQEIISEPSQFDSCVVG